jgi:hypothetical protein
MRYRGRAANRVVGAELLVDSSGNNTDNKVAISLIDSNERRYWIC